MKRLLAICMIAILGVCCLQADSIAQSWPNVAPVDPDDIHAIDRGPGGYLSWWKLSLCLVVFLVWIKTADWINRDAQLVQSRTRMTAELWNPFVVGLFFVGFVLVIGIPFFAVGFPVYVLTASVPFLIYVVARNSRVRETDTVFTVDHLRRKMGKGRPLIEPPADQDQGPPVEIQAAGADEAASASNLIRARQTQMFETLKRLVFDAISRRANVIVLDYTSKAVVGKMQVDGIFHQLPPMERQPGDALLVALKHLAGLNPLELRPQQQGAFQISIGKEKFVCEFLSKGEKTGERVLLKFPAKKKAIQSLAQMGMWEDSVKKISQCTSSPGLVIVSALPGGGLTSTWQATIQNSDRITRDWIGIVDFDDRESEIENIEITRFDSRKGESIVGLLPSLLLKQPDGIVVPKIQDRESADLLVEQALSEERTVLTRVQARTAVEALLRIMSVVGDRNKFIRVVSLVTNQRLVRRLCDSCKQPAPSNAKLIQQLGGDPNKPPVIYTQFKKPNPLPVDDKGDPVEIPTCQVCGGLGYIGMIGVFETLLVNDTLRRGLAQQPDLPTITKLAIEQGNRTLAQGGYRLVLAGLTSIPEIQRVLKPAN